VEQKDIKFKFSCEVEGQTQDRQYCIHCIDLGDS